jgi:LysR family transcriptional regulator of gallate degradation
MLTPAGERRARGFGLAMAELRSGFAEVAAWQGKACGADCGGSNAAEPRALAAETILRFAKAHPGVDVAVVEGSHSELAGPLRDGEIDLMLGGFARSGGAGRFAAGGGVRGPACLGDAGGASVAGGERDHGALLARFPWILPARDTPLRQYWEDMMREAGAEPPHVSIECGSVLTVRQLLLGSDALTLLSAAQLAVELQAGVLAARPTPVPVRAHDRRHFA